jgi:hypothetical protein
MDIEGAEKIVVLDIVSVLDKVDNFFVEYHDFENEKRNLGEILHILEMKGFQYYLYPVSKPLKQPFMHMASRENSIFQVNIFAKRYCHLRPFGVQ